MSRSKTVAISLLAGCVLLGGILGFTLDRVIRPETACKEERVDRDTARRQFSDEVGLNEEQRLALYTILDERNEKLDSINATIRGTLDSVYASIRPFTREVHDSARVKFRALLTPEQMENFEAMRRRDREAHESEGSTHDRNR